MLWFDLILLIFASVRLRRLRRATVAAEWPIGLVWRFRRSSSGASGTGRQARLLPASMEATNATALNRIVTPNRLRMSSLDQEESYLIARSFVRYLVETYGMKKLRTLYALTPLVPGTRSAGGGSARWQKIYGKSIHDLAADWSRAITR